jgi:hypothetical protein
LAAVLLLSDLMVCALWSSVFIGTSTPGTFEDCESSFCRDQLKKEVGRLQTGLAALFQAIQKPTSDMVQLQSDQVQLNGVVSDLDKTKAEVTASISQLATKCSQLDQAVPELREKLENAVATITVCSTTLTLARAVTIQLVTQICCPPWP